MKFGRKFGIVALVALVFTILPGGGPALTVVLTILTIAFFTMIAMLGHRLYQQFRFELDTLTDRQRLVLYGSIALALLAFCATSRMFGVGAAGVIGWFSALGACSFGLYWVWVQYRSYS